MYGLMVCNPLYDCFEANYLCESQFNMTQTKDWTQYYPNDTISAHFEINNAGQCKSVRQFMFDYGWSSYRVAGQLQYCCDRKCGGNKCIRRGVVDYTIQQFNDCSLNETSLTECAVGCLDGVCIDEIPDSELVRSPSGNPFNWIIQEAEYNMGTVVMQVFAVGISTGSGIYATVVSKKWEIGAMSTMGLILLFLTLGWLPQIVAVLWILSVALLIGYMISGKRD